MNNYTVKAVYSAYHITDDIFFTKLLMGANMSSFISSDCDNIIFLKNENDGNENVQIHKYNNSGSYFLSNYATSATKHITHEEFLAFIKNAESTIHSSDLGEIKNTFLLYYDMNNFYLAGDKNDNFDISSLNIIFVYIQSDIGEFVIPCTVNLSSTSNTEIPTVLEDNKIYSLQECSQIMKNKVTVIKNSNTENTTVIYPWQITIVCIILSVIVTIFVIKKNKKITCKCA